MTSAPHKHQSTGAKLHGTSSTSKLNLYHEDLQRKMNKVIEINKQHQPHLIELDYEINFANSTCKVPDFIVPQLNSVMDPVKVNLLECRQIIK